MNTFLSNHPLLYPLLKEILVGTLFLVVVLIFHGSAINKVTMRFDRFTDNNLARKEYNWVFLHFYVAFNSFALIHIFEVLLWAGFLITLGLVDDTLAAIIFSGSCYTTVGFAPDNLPHGWKSLAFFIAFTGLFSLAWTTSSMIGMTSVYQQAWRAKYKLKHH